MRRLIDPVRACSRPFVPWLALLLLLLLLFPSSGCRAAVLYVNARSASPAPTGASWQDAFRTVPQAVAIARGL